MQDQPVKSAKEAINAMYSAGNLSDYLGKTNSKSIHSRSATQAARAKVRPAARLRTIADSVDPLAGKALASSAERVHKKPSTPRSVVPPVVRTSLKLGPKKPPIVAKTRAPRPASDLRAAISAAKKGPIAVAQPAAPAAGAAGAVPGASRPSAPADPVSVIKSAAKSAIKESAAKRPTPVAVQHAAGGPRSARPAAGARVVDGFARRPAKRVAPRSAALFSEPLQGGASARFAASGADLADAPLAENHNPLASIRRRSAPERPADSVKNRFRPAPKGYAAMDAREASAGRPYASEDFLNPNHPARSHSYDDDGSVHLYGMMDGPESYSDMPAWANPGAATGDSDLGVIEDYHRPAGAGAVHIPDFTGDFVADESLATSGASASDTEKAPDNNRYVLGAKSPFFLSSVSVEKRPLSGGRAASAGSSADADETRSARGASAKRDASGASSRSAASGASHSGDSYTPDSAAPASRSGAFGAPAKPARRPAAKDNFSDAIAADTLGFVPEENGDSSKPRKNTYKKSTPQGQSTPGKRSVRRRAAKDLGPTVIIPARRRSHAPIFLLLLLTVILGAIVGALAYLCFFQ